MNMHPLPVPKALGVRWISLTCISMTNGDAVVLMVMDTFGMYAGSKVKGSVYSHHGD